MRIRLTVYNDHDSTAKKCLCIPCLAARAGTHVAKHGVPTGEKTPWPAPVVTAEGRDADGKYTWETLAKMGWTNAQAAEHRGVTLKGADNNLQQKRKKLRAQGWTFQAPVKPPTPDGRVWTATGSDNCAESVPPPIAETRAERLANDALRSGFATRFKATGIVRK